MPSTGKKALTTPFFLEKSQGIEGQTIIDSPDGNALALVHPKCLYVS
jgi:hypothetical protein